jgi:hypothetical protein
MKISNKSLTKHLYRLDEVLSSLRWSIITHNIQETAFWTLELCESNFEQECLDMLESIWLYTIGFGSWYSLRLIQLIYDEGSIEQENLIEITCALAKRRLTDSSIFHLLLRGATSPDWKPRFPHSKEYTTVQKGVEDCLRRGKLNEAWLLGRSMDVEEQWSMLETIATHKRRSEELSILKDLRPCVYENLAASYVLVNLDEVIWISSQTPIENKIPKEIEEAINEWQSETSMRKRRAITPRVEALLYLTDRSEQSPYLSSEPDIQLGFLESLKASEYWSCILEHYMINLKTWKSDDHLESFYETYFPEDIPDEWSVESRERSHGRGLGKTIPLARSRFIHTTLQRSKSLELWNSQFNLEMDCTMDWDTLYSVKPVFQLPLKPIKKILTIVSHTVDQSCL